MTDHRSLDLFADAQTRAEEAALAVAPPDQLRFPVNFGAHRVSTPVLDDLLSSAEPLMITGYASLDRFIQFCGKVGTQRPRVLFGHEPYTQERGSYALDGAEFSREVEAYWLRQNISLLHSAALLHTMELLEKGHVQARYVGGGRRMHAKIYVGEAAATVGSSNFTDPGLDFQYEANARFERNARGGSKRYAELRQLAEAYWSLGKNYNAELIALLRKLLRFVSWQEALARAAAELLEGEWAEAYLRDGYLGEADKLWPSQRQGIAQALAVLSSTDSVLIADATGAGKTRMGAYLIGAIRDDIVRRGRIRNRANTVMVCPPAVIESWEREKQASLVPMEVYSHGGLSHRSSRLHEVKAEAIKRAQILCVDEGHNFLNLKTQRTQMLLRNMADHVVMLTATPINRSVTDLLRIADVLGADNLEQDTLKAFEKMLGKPNITRALTEHEVRLLRAEIRKFTVRRTKSMLNALIEREPERYTDRNGRPCRFPKHLAKVYRLDEPDEDRRRAQQIRELAQQLHGVTHFERPIEMPLALRKQGVTEEQYLTGRLNSARKLVYYLILATLRSSRAALIEHIEGTEAAVEAFKIRNFAKRTEGGNILGRVLELAGKPPQNKLSIDLPDWLTDADRHREVCEQDAAIYRQIAALCKRLSGGRERHKAAQLLKLTKRHKLVLAFDSRPISLAVIREMLKPQAKLKVLMAWGDALSDKRRIMNLFAPGSEAEGIVGLCSDSLAEGVNLQQASALMHLDMPSVVRIAEQRAGRVDRLDTLHDTVEVWWPEDAPEFALVTDEKFVQRYETVDKLLGSNMPLPEHLAETQQTVSVRDMIQEYEANAADPWDGLDDAFSPVRSLVHGERALVDAAIYERYRHVTERVLSRVSLVRSRSPWAFFCLTAGAFDAPRWLMLPGYNQAPVTAMAEVCELLRERLGPEIETINDQAVGAGELERFIRRLVVVERDLLSRKKRRALEELERCVRFCLQRASAAKRQQPVEQLDLLLRVLTQPNPERNPDWDALATRWLDLIRPVWFEKLEAPKRQKPLLLKDLYPDLTAKPDWLEAELLEQFQQIPSLRGPDRRIRACIVGVPA